MRCVGGRCCPQRSCTGVGVWAYTLAATVWMPRAVAKHYAQFGSFGIALDFMTWFTGFAFLVIGAAVLGPVLAEGDNALGRWLLAGPAVAARAVGSCASAAHPGDPLSRALGAAPARHDAIPVRRPCAEPGSGSRVRRGRRCTSAGTVAGCAEPGGRGGRLRGAAPHRAARRGTLDARAHLPVARTSRLGSRTRRRATIPPAEEPPVELPGGGRVLFPGRRLVALYGHPGAPSLGVLGEQGVAAAVAARPSGGPPLPGAQRRPGGAVVRDHRDRRAALGRVATATTRASPASAACGRGWSPPAATA